MLTLDVVWRCFTPYCYYPLSFQLLEAVKWSFVRFSAFIRLKGRLNARTKPPRLQHLTPWRGGEETHMLCHLRDSCSSRFCWSQSLPTLCAEVFFFPTEWFLYVCVCFGCEASMCHLEQQNHLIYKQLELVIIRPVQTCFSSTEFSFWINTKINKVCNILYAIHLTIITINLREDSQMTDVCTYYCVY